MKNKVIIGLVIVSFIVFVSLYYWIASVAGDTVASSILGVILLILFLARKSLEPLFWMIVGILGVFSHEVGPRYVKLLSYIGGLGDDLNITNDSKSNIEVEVVQNKQVIMTWKIHRDFDSPPEFADKRVTITCIDFREPYVDVYKAFSYNEEQRLMFDSVLQEVNTKKLQEVYKKR